MPCTLSRYLDILKCRLSKAFSASIDDVWMEEKFLKVSDEIEMISHFDYKILAEMIRILARYFSLLRLFAALLCHLFSFQKLFRKFSCQKKNEFNKFQSGVNSSSRIEIEH